MAIMEIKPMNEAIDKAIKKLAEAAADAKQSYEAMQLTQAALNLAHTKQVLAQVKQ
jgi:hypothetical protein